jgi:pilus assembly protein Flp/PilA
MNTKVLAQPHPMLGTFRPDAGEFEGCPAMTKLLRRFMLCRQGVTAIEYALLGSGVALAIVTGVSTVGTNLSASFAHIASAFP